MHASASPLALLRLCWVRRDLIAQLAAREAFARYRGSWLGLGWALLTPLLLMGVYTFVFTEVFGARWPGAGVAGGEAGRLDYALALYCGLLVFGFFADVALKAPLAIVAQASVVKKLVFPLELLPLVQVLAALAGLALGALVLLAFEALAFGRVPLTFPLLPLVLLPLLFWNLAVAWFLGALGVFMRDIGHGVGIVVTGLMFLSPLFFPAERFPERYRFVIDFNPLAVPIEQARAVAVFGRLPDWSSWSLALLVSMLLAWLALAWFQQLRRGFADVL